jgi:hypothetical protein
VELLVTPPCQAGDLAQKSNESTPKKSTRDTFKIEKKMTRKMAAQNSSPFSIRQGRRNLCSPFLSHSGIGPKGSPPQHRCRCRRSQSSLTQSVNPLHSLRRRPVSSILLVTRYLVRYPLSFVLYVDIVV